MSELAPKEIGVIRMLCVSPVQGEGRASVSWHLKTILKL